MASISRKIELYGMHSHEAASGGYVELFQRLKSIRRRDRVVEVSKLVLALPVVRQIGNLYFIQVTEGDPSAARLVLNRRTGETRDAALDEGDVLSEATHLLVDPGRRRVVIEYVRRGAKAAVIGAAIEGILRENFDDYAELRFEFSAIITQDFSKQIDRFERIREAKIRVIKPNASWTDHYTELSELIESSNGEKAEIDIRAGRGEGLSKSDGLVKVIKDVVSDDQPYVDEAAITGTRKGESAETTVRATKHIAHARVSMPVDSAGVPAREVIIDRFRSFLSSRT